MRGAFTIATGIVVQFASPVISPAWAGDRVLTGPVPDWVSPSPPLNGEALSRAGTVIPLFDEQVRIDGDTTTTFFDTATVISSPEVLAQRGTLKMNWQPDRGDLTFHRLEILRDGAILDVLNGGAGITVLRREAGLEKLVVDGQLTAVKQFEGLRVGDTLRAAFSLSARDKSLGGNVQAGLILIPSPTRINFGRARLVWRNNRQIAWNALAPGVTASPRPLGAEWTEIVIPLPIAKLPEVPKNAPSRFQPVPVLQYSSFSDWAAVAKIMAPHYVAKGLIAPGSDLAARVDAIASRSQDPLRRMADALRIVQDEVRYQFVALGTGNYIPQSPTETWGKRYGDCKAKSLLLLAMLDRLGIEAEAVLANTTRGDAVGQMLPAVGAFDHVLVRARVGGADFWLDGTMLGSRLADIHDVPRFGQVLPLSGAVLSGTAPALLDLPRRAHARADLEVDIAYDMSSGPHLPAPFRLILRHAGSFAATNNVQQSADYEEKLIEYAEKAAKNWVDSTTIGKPYAEYDAEQSVWTLTMDGVAYPDWEYRDQRYALPITPSLVVAYDAPRDRAAWRAIPALINAPWSARSRMAIRLPDGGKGVSLVSAETTSLDLPAVNWRRSFTMSGADAVEDIVSFETGAEISADKTSTTERAIADAMAKTARIELEKAYPRRSEDITRRRNAPALVKVRAIFDQRIAAMPDNAARFADRAWLQEQLLDWAGAEADYTRAIALEGSAAHFLARAELRSQRGDAAGALKDAEAAYDLEQGNKEARSSLATELAKAGRVDEALDVLPATPDLNTEDGLSDFLQRIDVLELGGRHDEALEMLDAALEKRGSSAELRNARCWYQALRNSNLDVALADCNRAIELASNPAPYLDSRAMVHFRAGNLALARSDYDAALAEIPDLPGSLYMSAIVSRRLGEKARADMDQRAALRLLPAIESYYQRFGIQP